MAQAVQDNLEVPKWFKNLVSQHRPQKSVAIFLGFPEGTRQNKGCCKIDNFIFIFALIFTFLENIFSLFSCPFPPAWPRPVETDRRGRKSVEPDQIYSVFQLAIPSLAKDITRKPENISQQQNNNNQIFLLNNIYRM